MGYFITAKSVEDLQSIQKKGLTENDTVFVSLVKSPKNHNVFTEIHLQDDEVKHMDAGTGMARVLIDTGLPSRIFSYNVIN